MQRQGGADSQDVLGFDTFGSFFSDTTVDLRDGSTNIFATYTSSGGVLSITFTGGHATSFIVNNALQHISYFNSSDNPTPSVTLDYTFNDQSTALGGPLSDTQSLTVDITVQNDAPVNTVPGAQTPAEDTPTDITGLSVSDADAGSADITVNLTVTHGTITVINSVIGGVGAGGISGNGGASVTLTGSQSAIDATLAATHGVVYQGATDYNGADTLTVTTNDLGHSPNISPNLIQDPGAEASTAGSAPVGWTVTAGNPTVEDYATFGGLSNSDSTAINGGLLYFTGGNSATSSAKQIIDVSSFAARIDGGAEFAQLRGYFGGFTTQDDNVVLTAHFLNASSVELGTDTIGGVLAADRGNTTEALLRTDNHLVPVGTRFIELDLTSTRTEGTDNDAYADNLSLTLDDPLQDQDTVAITVTAVNDPPTANPDPQGTIAEDAGAQLILGTTLAANDTVGPATATDETVSQTLVVTGASNPTGGTVSFDGTTVTFTPTANFNGSAGFDYTVQDDGTTDGNADPRTATSHASFTITAVQDANDDTGTTNEDTAVTVDVLANDGFGGGATVSNVSNATHGTVVINNDNTVTYTPFADFNGSDSFTYTADTTGGTAETATVNVTINAVQDANNDILSTNEDTAGTVDVLSNDTFGAGKTVTGVSNGAHGTVVDNGNGTVTYTPVANFNGSDSFTYTANSTDGIAETATVNVTVSAVQDANNDSLTTNEDTAGTSAC